MTAQFGGKGYAIVAVLESAFPFRARVRTDRGSGAVRRPASRGGQIWFRNEPFRRETLKDLVVG